MGSGVWLRKGKVLAHLMFVVLYVNLSTLFAFCAINLLNFEKKKNGEYGEERSLFIYIFIDSEGLGPLPTYP